MLQYLLERGLPTDHVVYLPNGVDIDAFDASAIVEPDDSAGPALDAIKRLRSDGRFVVGYVGAFGSVNRVDVIVEAAAQVEARWPGRLGLVLVGDGPERPALEPRGSRAIVFAGAAPKRSVPIILRALDATVVHSTRTPVYRYGISFNKLLRVHGRGASGGIRLRERL